MVTIIVPVYNTPNQYLNKCIKSLLSQTYRNIEILLIDDGSNRKTAEYCDQAASTDQRILTLHKKNGGVSSARNLGIQCASGEYISFVDSDDWVEPDFIEILVKGIECFHTDLSIVNFIYEYSEEEETLNRIHRKAVKILPSQELWKQLLYSTEIGGFLWNKLFKKELITQRLNESLHYSEDFVFTASYAVKVNNAAFADEKVYHYRQRQGNASSDLSYNEKVFSLLHAYQILEKLYQYNAPEELPNVKKNTLKIALNLRARYKVSEARNPTQYKILTDTIRKYMAPVLKSDVSITSKINILLTWIFPTVLFRVKNKVLGRRL